MLKKSLLAISSIILFTQFSFADCKKEVIIGWEPYEPFQNKDLSGLDFDIMKSVLDKMGCKYKFVEKPWKRVLAEMEAGTIHMAGSASKTPEREKFAFFSDSYVKTNSVIFTRKGDAQGIKIQKLIDLASIPNFKLGVTRAYEYGTDYSEAMKNPKFKAITEEADDETMNLKKLVQKRFNAGVFNEFTAKAIAKNEKVMDQIEVHPYIVSADDAYMMISKKGQDEAFVKDFNFKLADIKKSGEYQKILDKYLK